jgi:hypothetical protein
MKPSLRFPRQGGIYRSDVWKVKVKTIPPGGGMPPPVGRPPSPGKRRDGRRASRLIVRDEFRTGYSSIGLLASRARLRFTGILILKPFRDGAQ